MTTLTITIDDVDLAKSDAVILLLQSNSIQFSWKLSNK